MEFMNDKRVLVGLFIISIFYEMTFKTSLSLKGLYEGLGLLFIDMFVWFILFGVIGVSLVHTVYNFTNPDNSIEIGLRTRMSISLIMGVLFGVIKSVV